MSPFDPEPYAAGWRRRNREEADAIARRTEAARREAAGLAERMGREAGAERVFLFGSTADEAGPRRLDFNIDLALDGGDWEKAREIADASGFAVDLLEYRRAPEHIRRRVDRSGVVLYPRGD